MAGFAIICEAAACEGIWSASVAQPRARGRLEARRPRQRRLPPAQHRLLRLQFCDLPRQPRHGHHVPVLLSRRVALRLALRLARRGRLRLVLVCGREGRPSQGPEMALLEPREMERLLDLSSFLEQRLTVQAHPRKELWVLRNKVKVKVPRSRFR